MLIFALLPAFQASKNDVIAALKDGGRAATTRRRRFWSTAFLAAQVALTVVLLAQVAVAIRSNATDLWSEDPLDTPEIITAALTLPAASCPTAAARLAFYDRLDHSQPACQPGRSADGLARRVSDAGTKPRVWGLTRRALGGSPR